MWGDIISGGLKFLGGFFDRDAQQRANQQSENWAREQQSQNLALSRELNEKALADKERDRALQREFAQSGLQWKAADAKAAGIHPIFGIGGSGAAYSPSPISLVSPGSVSAPDFKAASLGGALSGMGQDIGRAVNASRSDQARDEAYNTSVKALGIERAGLENELLRSQIAKLNASRNPGMPTATGKRLLDGQGDAPPAPEHVGLRGGGAGVIPTDTDISDAQKFEDRYGEMSDWIAGPYIAWRDYQKWRSQDPRSWLDRMEGKGNRARRARSGSMFVSKSYRD